MLRPPLPTAQLLGIALFLTGLAFLAGSCSNHEEGKTSLTVFAAASLREALEEFGEDFEARTGCELIFNFAGSNVLAQQIAAAPLADVYLSANQEWVDELVGRGLLVAESQIRFAYNQLAIIVHASSAIDTLRPADLADLDFQLLAIANPKGVPAGRYAREYLKGVPSDDGSSVWERVQNRIAPAIDVRAALALVESDPEVFGVVYRSDAIHSSKVRVVYRVQEGPAISYHGALLPGAGDHALATKFLTELLHQPTQAMFEKHGFTTLR